MKKTMLFVGVLISMLAAYLIIHAAVYLAIIKFFAITAPLARKILIGIFVFLAASFFLATWLSHLNDNVATRAYYFFAGSWVGLLVNLLLFFGLAWIMIFASKLVHINLRLDFVAMVAIGAAILCSAYGMWNAFSPQVTKLTISIDNLPPAWVGKKIVQISDVHLGHIYTPAYMNKVAEQISALKPDAIVITGDLFDGTDGKLDDFVAPLNKLAAPQGIYFVDGNHETYLGTDKAFAVIGQTKIIPLRDQMKVVDGLQFVGVDYPERMETKNLEETIKNIPDFNPAKPSILLWHIPTQIEGAKAAGISLQLSGHTHKGQLFPFGFITSLVFHGYDYGFKREGSYAIYTSSGLGGWGPPMRTEKTSEIVEITLR